MFLKDLFFPKLCLGCGSIGWYICRSCEAKLKSVKNDICIYCKKKNYMGLTHPGCKKAEGVDGLMTLYYYNDFLKKIIKAIKYQLAKDVFYDFSLIMQSEIREKILFYKQILKNGLLQPVPLHKIRLNFRGFNQATLVADFFNIFLKLPIVDYFERKKKTPFQAVMKTKLDRYRNIRGAFQPKKNIDLAGKAIAIVDDVVTSGFTVFELAKAIKQSGADRVYVMALAKG